MAAVVGCRRGGKRLLRMIFYGVPQMQAIAPDGPLAAPAASQLPSERVFQHNRREAAIRSRF